MFHCSEMKKTELNIYVDFRTVEPYVHADFPIQAFVPVSDDWYRFTYACLTYSDYGHSPEEMIEWANGFFQKIHPAIRVHKVANDNSE